MSKFKHALFHIVVGIATVSTVASGIVPAKYSPVVVAVGSLAQAVRALIGDFDADASAKPN